MYSANSVTDALMMEGLNSLDIKPGMVVEVDNVKYTPVIPPSKSCPDLWKVPKSYPYAYAAMPSVSFKVVPQSDVPSSLGPRVEEVSAAAYGWSPGHASSAYCQCQLSSQ